MRCHLAVIKKKEVRIGKRIMNQRHVWNDLEHVNNKKGKDEPILVTLLEGVADVGIGAYGKGK